MTDAGGGTRRQGCLSFVIIIVFGRLDMAKATKTTTTTTDRNPDAELFSMIKRCAALWRESMKLEDEAARLHQSDKAAEISKLEARAFEARKHATDLELRIAYADVHTEKGFAAQCRSIVEADFDADDMIHVAFHLGRQAERLGIEHAPNIQRAGDCEGLAEAAKAIVELWLPDQRLLDAERIAAR